MRHPELVESPEHPGPAEGREQSGATKVKPAHIRLEASSFCQLRCPSCPTTTGAIQPAVGSGFLRFEDFRRLVDRNPFVRWIELSNYGEIFLNPHLLSILEYAHAKGVTLLVRNGANLNHVKDEVLEGVVKFGVRSIACSIDGASAETYRKYRVRGDFDAVIRNIRRINHYKTIYQSEFPRLHWQFIVFGHNEHEIPLAREMARELRMGFRTKLTWDPNFSPIRNPDFVRAQRKEPGATREEFERLTGRRYMDLICHQLWDQPQVNWNGKILGCCRNFWGEFGGNAFEDGLDVTLNSEKMTYAREMLSGRQPARDDIPCTSCEMYREMCKSAQFVDRGKAPSRP
jgi:MoaA/NifB/PqqE/SkfB family radical SAM enzyme